MATLLFPGGPNAIVLKNKSHVYYSNIIYIQL